MRSGAPHIGSTSTVSSRVAVFALMMGLAWGGCGGSSPSSAPSGTSAASGQSTPANFSVTIPNLPTDNLLPKRYTCSGKDVPIPLQWKGIPPGTAELAMVVVNAHPVDEKLVFDWAVTGLKPTSIGISAGRLPAGAIVGRNSFWACRLLAMSAKRQTRRKFCGEADCASSRAHRQIGL